MVTRVLLAVFVVLTLVCGGVAIYYNRVFDRPQDVEIIQLHLRD